MIQSNGKPIVMDNGDDSISKKSTEKEWIKNYIIKKIWIPIWNTKIISIIIISLEKYESLWSFYKHSITYQSWVFKIYSYQFIQYQNKLIDHII